VTGLDLVPGTNVRFDVDRKVPHMGWNELEVERDHPLVEGVDGEYAYFVHSYYAEPDDPDAVVATADYGVDFPPPSSPTRRATCSARSSTPRRAAKRGSASCGTSSSTARSGRHPNQGGSESEPVLQPVVRAGLCGSQAVDLLVGQIDRSGREILRELGGRVRAPTMGAVTPSRWASHASAVCAGVASTSSATASSLVVEVEVLRGEVRLLKAARLGGLRLLGEVLVAVVLPGQEP